MKLLNYGCDAKSDHSLVWWDLKGDLKSQVQVHTQKQSMVNSLVNNWC